MADTAIHPMQDELGLDGSSRMNLPGVGEGYWEWQFGWDQVKPVHAQRLVRLRGCMGVKGDPILNAALQLAVSQLLQL